MDQNFASYQNPLPGTTICHHLGGSHKYMSSFSYRNWTQGDTVLTFLSPEVGEELNKAPGHLGLFGLRSIPCLSPC